MTDLIQALLAPRCYPHPVREVRLIETHISWVLLAGDYAYKIKKPVALGFVDFSTLERRRRFCQQELVLNRRLAPALYLDVVPICGSPACPVIGTGGEPIEYAVKMHAFEQCDILSEVSAAGRLTAAHIDRLADTCARFHAGAAIAPPASDFGAPSAILAAALDNFQAIEATGATDAERSRIERLRVWTTGTHARLAPRMAARRATERIRECHGDMHLGNIALIDDTPTIFDCIEFNDDLRWIDVMSEIAFLVMDLVRRGHVDFAYRFLNRYLEETGDYEGVALLDFYIVYRAMVRAKVDAIRWRQSTASPAIQSAAWRDFVARIEVAEAFARERKPFLAITCGLSGSGKTHVSQIALEHAGAIRIRSDVERKRLHGLAPDTRSGSGLDAGIYGNAATRATFATLEQIARELIDAGYPVIVDATFLKSRRRHAFRALAEDARVPFVIVHCAAPAEELARRIELRAARASDASEATLEVLRAQQSQADPLHDTEQAFVLPIDTRDEASIDAAVRRLRAITDR